MYILFLALCLYLTYRLLNLVSHATPHPRERCGSLGWGVACETILNLCCVRTVCKNKTERNAVDEPPPDQEQAPLIVPVTTVSVNDFVADSMYADRILNPDEYNKQYSQYIPTEPLHYIITHNIYCRNPLVLCVCNTILSTDSLLLRLIFCTCCVNQLLRVLFIIKNHAII